MERLTIEYIKPFAKIYINFISCYKCSYRKICLEKQLYIKLEKVQRRATKFIQKTEDTRLKKLNLLSLENRRLLADVTFLYKAPHGITDIDVRHFM